MQRSYTNYLFHLATICLIIALSSLVNLSLAQNCGCAHDLCCSKYGYCGTGDAYCGPGCQSGPCSGGGGSVADIVSDAFFNGIIAGTAGNCEGRGFYTRSAFFTAVGSFGAFGTTGSNDVRRREIAAFFANVAHNTGRLCYINQIDGRSNNYCDTRYPQYPCEPGRLYYGRGPLQLTWNYNYGAAGRALSFDGLGDPDALARDRVLAFRTALWYWMRTCHSPITSGQGFGATIRAINGALECDGHNPNTVTSRVNYYTQYCQELGVSPGDNLRC